MTASNPNIPFVNILSPLLIAAYLQHGEISRDRQEASNGHSRREMAVDHLEDHVRRSPKTLGQYAAIVSSTRSHRGPKCRG